jgi:hypothetical protein
MADAHYWQLAMPALQVRAGSAEQGDVVIIGSNQTSLFYGKDNNIPIPEVDLTDTAYARASAASSARSSGRWRRRAANRSGLDHTKVEPGQTGFFVTLGAFAHDTR